MSPDNETVMNKVAETVKLIRLQSIGEIIKTDNRTVNLSIFLHIIKRWSGQRHTAESWFHSGSGIGVLEQFVQYQLTLHKTLIWLCDYLCHQLRSV